MEFVAECIHGLPKAVVEKRVDLAFRDEALDGFAFEHLAVVGDAVDDFRREDEEAAVDPSAFVAGFFLEGINLRVMEAESAEARDGLHAC